MDVVHHAKARHRQESTGEQIDTATGEITQAAGDLFAGDRAAELQDDLNYVKQAARANGWDARLVAERDRLQDELALLAPAIRRRGCRTPASRESPLRAIP